MKVLEWFTINWTFVLPLLVLFYIIAYKGKENRDMLLGLVFFYLIVWVPWRLLSNYLFNQWGLSSLDAWTLDSGRISLTIIGWIYFFIMVAFSFIEGGTSDKEKEAKKEQKKSDDDEASIGQAINLLQKDKAVSSESEIEEVPAEETATEDLPSSQSSQEKTDKKKKSDDLFDNI